LCWIASLTATEEEKGVRKQDGLMDWWKTWEHFELGMRNLQRWTDRSGDRAVGQDSTQSCSASKRNMYASEFRCPSWRNGVDWLTRFLFDFVSRVDKKNLQIS
jgi:hypothetical protein